MPLAGEGDRGNASIFDYVEACFESLRSLKKAMELDRT